MMEGKLLSFMKQSDIYSLFGNAVDNAIKAVERLSDDERRYISVRVRTIMREILLFIRVCRRRPRKINDITVSV